jgi:hypothetical protein
VVASVVTVVHQATADGVEFTAMILSARSAVTGNPSLLVFSAIALLKEKT